MTESERGVVLRGGAVLTLDPAGTVHTPGAVAVVGGRIASVGTPATAPPWPTVDMPDCLLLPGLVNTHTHSPMWLYRGLTEDVPRGEWLTGRMRPLERRVGPEELRAGALAGCLELLGNGVTTIADRYAHMEAVAAAVEASGLRAIVAHSLYDTSAEDGLATTERLLARFGSDPAHSRITAGLGPHACDSCGPDLLRRVRRLADDSGGRVFIHLAQSAEEVAVVRARGFAGPAAYLDALGLLAPDVVAAHGTYLTDQEAELVGRRGTAIAHCPSSNAKLEARVAPIGRLRTSGAVVGLGTDAASCNNGMDMLEEMKVAGLLNKVASGDPAAFSGTELLRMATIDGARALGLDHLVGSLETGKRADVIAVRAASPRVAPWHDPVANLVYAARGSDVAAVWVDGEQLVRDGQPTRLDSGAIVAAGRAAAEALHTFSRR